MGFFAVYLAVSDPSQSVIPNYYKKGLDWDKTKALLTASEQLGWSVHVTITPDSPTAVKRSIRLTILDRDGKTVQSATGSLSIFHHAHAKHVQELVLQEEFPGVYTCEADMSDAGKWDMTLHLKREETEFLWRTEEILKWSSAETEDSRS